MGTTDEDDRTEERESNMDTGVPLTGSKLTVFFSSESVPNVYQEVLCVRGEFSLVDVVLSGKDLVRTFCHHFLFGRVTRL